MSNRTDDTIKDIQNFKKNLKEASKNTQDVKEGKATPEEEQQEPGYILYNAIADTVTEILKQPMITKTFDELDESDEERARLYSLIAVCMTHSAYGAIVTYDDLLKKELEKQFQNIGDAFNTVAGDVKGITGALEVYKKKLDDLEKKVNVSSLKVE